MPPRARLTLLAAVLFATWTASIRAGTSNGDASVRQSVTSVPPAARATVEMIDDFPPPEPARYGRDVRPILADRCFACHGADAAKRKAGLRLDRFDSATADLGGYAAIVPGDVDASELARRIASDDPDERMPPPASHKRTLSAEERDVIRRWIAAGARYEPHWSFVAPLRPPLPPVANAVWARNEIDRFVLARLEREHVEPSPEADRATLLRRVFLDLTGLPPTPEELDRFAVDARRDAYERWVERLLTQDPYRSRYAERMTSAWLDLARYADTSGLHTDAGRSMWPWRDWVLAAFRDGLSYDRFLTEQLAGDLLPDATPETEVASGFNRNHVTTDEVGAIEEECLVEYAVDRAVTTSTVFLGLTMGCARCHDHKFDPITQTDFYRFLAFFNSIDEPGLYKKRPDPNLALEPGVAVPAPRERAALDELAAELAKLEAEQRVPAPGEDEEHAAFLAATARESGLEWEELHVVAATATGGGSLELLADGSVRAIGDANDASDATAHVHVLTLHAEQEGLRIVSLEALFDPDDASSRSDALGRSPAGAAVLTGIELEIAPLADPERSERVPLAWAWADAGEGHGADSGVEALDASDALGWNVDARRTGGRAVALFLTERAFGFPGGTRVDVRLSYRSERARHSFRRVRVRVGRIGEHALASLPLASGAWHRVGPFAAESGADAHERAFGPEADSVLDLARDFDGQHWERAPDVADERREAVLPGIHATYVGRRIHAPSARRLELVLGCDDALRVFHDGREVFARKGNRRIGMNPATVALDLHAGANTLVLKVANTGGQAAFSYRSAPRTDELAGDLAAALAPESARNAELGARLRVAWRATFSPEGRACAEEIARAREAIAAIAAVVPRAMVMRELAEPRTTCVLVRGAYDQRDESRPVTRGVPEALGSLASDVPLDRLGLARWMTSPENPLTARVAVNRFWELLFGSGIVLSSDDFGAQGEWPSHPELLDWLAVEFRASGWDVRALLTRIVTSSTYRQSSRARVEQAEIDPENRWLAAFPRRRLSAEAIRDQALYAAGLLVEKLGGPSVKPYQPPGVWEEVAMPTSNTRVYECGEGESLWRRSLYTYWKRAAPPPAMTAFDAPTREVTTVRRTTTRTPLQALVLWNDEQLVEAARCLAQRTLAEPPSEPSIGASAVDDHERLMSLFRRSTGRAPDDDEIRLLAGALATFRVRYASAPDDAHALVSVGAAPRPREMDARELAAWTLVANAVLSLDATVSIR